MKQVRRVSAIIFAVLAACVAAFQVALALGAPWGAYAMGGAFPDQYPPALRISALVQAAVILLMAAVILARAGLALARWSRAAKWAAWIIVVLMGVGVILNLITPSGGERLIWAPVVTGMFVCALFVATTPAAQTA